MAKPPDPLTDLIASTVAADDAIRQRVAAFAVQVLDEAEHLLRHGAPTIKLRLMQTVIATALRDTGKSAADDDAKMREGREEIQGMFDDVRQRLLNAGAEGVPGVAGVAGLVDNPPDVMEE